MKMTGQLNMQDINTVNRDFYDRLWTDSQLKRPDKLNTWPLISELLPHAASRLEIGPGLRPRLPIKDTCFLDISPPVVEKLTTCGGIAVTGEITNLPYSSSKFELVCAFDVIEHVVDDRRVFGEVSRVLKEGGILVFSVPIHERLWTRFDELVGHVRRYEPAELSALLAENNLVLERSAVYGMQPAAPILLNFGMWWLKHRRREAMWWYNRVLMPVGMFFQKKLKFINGLNAAAGADEIVLVCRKRISSAPA